MSRYISDDLVIEIFERLPTKSLIRFRSLSKLWYSRIASPDFIRRHRLQSAQQKVFIRHWDFYSDSMVEYWLQILIRQLDSTTTEMVLKRLKTCIPCILKTNSDCTCHGRGYFDTSTLDFSRKLPQVVNSCNGILCLFDHHESRITLWNPSIRRKLTLPDHHNTMRWCNLVFGFGFDPITDDYKIVKILYHVSKFDCEGTIENSDVYSMKTRTWSSTAIPPKFDRMEFEACFANEALHWGAAVLLESSDIWEDFIMSFNMSTHAFRRIELPEPIKSREASSKPTIIDGCLGVVSIDCQYCWIWVMKDYNNDASWYLHFKFSQLTMSSRIQTKRKNKKRKFRCVEESIRSVMQLPTNGYLLIHKERGGLEVYNPVTEVRFLLPGTLRDNVYMETCVESLELLDSGEPES